MSSIFLGAIDKDTDQQRIKDYNEYENKTKSYGQYLSGFDVSKLLVDHVRLTNGAIVKICPAYIAEQVRCLLERMRNDPLYSFIKPYIQKPVIWTYEAKTAFTDGIRIFMSPAFAYKLLKISEMDPEVNNWWKPLSTIEKHEEENVLKINNILTKHIRYVIVHEIYHILYNHVRRGILKYGSHPSKEEHDRANLAMDLEINRDIENTFPDLRGATKDIPGIWYEDPDYFKSDGTIFRRDIWEEIWDDWTENGVTHESPALPLNDEDANPVLENKAQLGPFADGWRKAIDAIKSGKIDPRTFTI